MKTKFITTLIYSVLFFLICVKGKTQILPENTISLAHAQNIIANSKILFIENKGQWDKNVLYMAKVGSLNTWITKNGIVYDFYKLEKIITSINDTKIFKSPKDPIETSLSKQVVKMSFNNNLSSGVTYFASGKSNQVLNYFIGNDPSKWAQNVSAFEEINLQNIYTNIDAKIYSDQNLLRYDFIVKPGGDIASISFSFEGQDGLYINNNGELVIKTSLGEVSQNNIFAYQEVNGIKKQIKCCFTKNTDDNYGFKVGEYDKKLPLIIDPLIYSTFLGGINTDNARDIAVDATGNAYVVGYTNSDNFPTQIGSYQLTKNNDYDIFVSELNSSGSGLIFSTYLGGEGVDIGYGIELCNDGNINICGSSTSNTFPTLLNSYNSIHSGSEDAVIVRLDHTGSNLLYSTYFGGTDLDRAYDIAIGQNNDIYITGYTLSDKSNYAKFPLFNSYTNVFKGQLEAYVAHFHPLNNMNSDLQYSTIISGSNHDAGDAISLDQNENAIVCGNTWSNDINTTANAIFSSSKGYQDAFICIINNLGNQLLFSTYYGGNNNERAFGIQLDNTGAIYIAGTTNSTDFPITNNAYQKILRGNSDAFLSKIEINNNVANIIYSTYLGGSNDESAYCIGLNRFNDPIIGGFTNSNDFPLKCSVQSSLNNNNPTSQFEDGFLTRFNSIVSDITFSSYIGGNDIDIIYGLIPFNDDILITGTTKSSDFLTKIGSFDLTHNIDYDAFICKIDPECICFAETDQSYEKISENLIIGANTYRTWSGKIYIADNVIVTVKSNTTLDLTNVDIVFGENAGINFENAILRANNSVFRPCNYNQTWRGLKFINNSGGTINECTFKNANNCLDFTDNSNTNINITNNLFENNAASILFKNNNILQPITGNTFIIDNKAIWEQNKELYGIRSKGITEFEGLLSQNDFINNQIMDNSNSHFFGMDLYGTHKANITKNNFSGLYSGINTNESSNLIIENNEFEVNRFFKNEHQIRIINSNNISIVGNVINNSNPMDPNISITNSAIYIEKSGFLNVTTNNISGFHSGIQCHNSNFNAFTNNIIIKCFYYGIYLENGNSNTISCNEISMNNSLPFNSITYHNGIGYIQNNDKVDHLNRIMNNCILDCSTAIYLECIGGETNLNNLPLIRNNFMYNYIVFGIRNMGFNGIIGNWGDPGENTFISNNINNNSPIISVYDIYSSTPMSISGNYGIINQSGITTTSLANTYYSTASCAKQHEITTYQNQFIDDRNICDQFPNTIQPTILINNQNDLELQNDYFYHLENLSPKNLNTNLFSLITIFSHNKNKKYINEILSDVKKTDNLTEIQKDFIEINYDCISNNFENAKLLISKISQIYPKENVLKELANIKLNFLENNLLSTENFNFLTKLVNDSIYQNDAKSLLQLIAYGYDYTFISPKLPLTIDYTKPDIMNDNLFSVYPNPVKEIINIKYYTQDITNLQLIITDITGKYMIKQELLNNGGILNYDIRNFPAGTYFVRFVNENQILHHSLFVKF